jgi:hypothetical protein
LSISSECGAAHWQSTKPRQLECEREARRRYWHTPRRIEPRGADEPISRLPMSKQ